MSRTLPRPQIYVTGEIQSVSKCWPCQVIGGSWRVQLGPSWAAHGGITHGNLQPSQTYWRTAVFNAPIDLNLSFSSPENWPRISIELEKLSRFGKSSLGEVAILLPNKPGRHELGGYLLKKSGTNGVVRTVQVKVSVEIVYSHLKSNGVSVASLNAVDS